MFRNYISIIINKHICINIIKTNSNMIDFEIVRDRSFAIPPPLLQSNNNVDRYSREYCMSLMIIYLTTRR